jgi:ABC-type branched-subunit amino acid transport system substrate-binding protein
MEPPRVNRVAVLVPMTGPDAAVGQALERSARLALLDSGTGAFQISVYDTVEGGAGAAAERAIASGHGLILGPLRSEEVRAVSPIAQQARVPVIAFSNDRDATSAVTYILGFTPTQAIERVVAEAAARGAKRFAAVVPTSTYGQRSAQALLAAVQRSDGQVVGVETYGRPEDARAAARRLGNRPYDAVLLGPGGGGRAQRDADPRHRALGRRQPLRYRPASRRLVCSSDAGALAAICAALPCPLRRGSAAPDRQPRL